MFRVIGMVKLLIDHDIILYKGLWATVNLGYFAGLRACDNLIYNILDRFEHPSFELVMTGAGNFRKEINVEYKANRKPESKPPYLFDAKLYYKKYWNAVETTGQEADDYIACNVTDSSIIVSTDKDFKQLGVPIFNPTKWELSEINDPEYWFWLQMLVGDKTDGVEGLKNPTKLHHKNQPCFTEDTASKLLLNKPPSEMKDTVMGLYKEIHGDNWYQKFDTTARLLFLRRKDHKEYYTWIN